MDGLSSILNDVLAQANDLVTRRASVDNARVAAIWELGDRITLLSGELAEAVSALKILEGVQQQLGEVAAAYSLLISDCLPPEDLAFTTVSSVGFGTFEIDYANYPALRVFDSFRQRAKCQPLENVESNPFQVMTPF